jgi:NAD+ synthase (glutamine-hydrolysing)
MVDPYALQDFNLFYLTRHGFRPSRIAYLAERAWGDVARGSWPTGIPDRNRRAYSRSEILHWLRVFLARFSPTSSKRSTLPNGPKISSGGSLSPRGDWRAPSDADARVWLEELGAAAPLATTFTQPQCPRT